MANSRQEKQQKWSQKVHQWKASGKSVAKWCEENDVSYSSLLYWRQRIDSSDLTEDRERSQFVELPVGMPVSPWMEISMHGAKLSIQKDYDVDALLHCLKILGGN